MKKNSASPFVLPARRGGSLSKDKSSRYSWFDRLTMNGHCITMNGFFVLCFMFCIAGSALAGTVQEIQSTYQSINDLRADFTQSTYVEVLEQTIKDHGIFSMKKPGKLRIEYTGEHPKTYISDGKKLTIISPELSQVETYKVSKDSVPKEALELLMGFGEMEKLFTIVVKDKFRLKLTPKTESAQYNWLDCEFGHDNLIKKMTIHNKSGNVSTYSFGKFLVNSGLDDSLFKR